MTEIERRVLAVLQEGFPNASRTPYADMAERIGMDIQDLLNILRMWKDQGKIRRLGAMVNHFQMDMGGGALVVWQVEPERLEDVGHCLAGFKAVSHAYQRPIRPGWPFNLYTMVHGADAQDTEQTVKRMSEACGVRTYRLLITIKELKKVPPTYIIPSEGLGQAQG